MMNVIALGLVLSSLVTAGVWSPSQDHGKGKIGRGGEEDVIVKEGHRVVVVEYDPKTDGNTKILISPQDTHFSLHDDARGEAKAAVEDAKGKAEETIDETKEEAKEAAGSTRDLVCDAFGKCKQKITNTLGRARDKASDAAHETTVKAQEVEEQAKERVSGAIQSTKDILSNETEKVSASAHEAKETVGRGIKEAKDTSKTIANDVAQNVTSKLGEGKEKVEAAREEGKRELVEIYGRGRELAKDILKYIVSPRLVGSAMGVVHLFGFATAYGMCVWVTFVSSNVLAGALPRQQFGMVQSKVYPVYFRILAYTVMVSLFGHLYGQRKNLLSNTVGMAQAYTLLGSFGIVLFNLLYLEPQATMVMFERMKLEKEEGRGCSSFLSDPTAKEAELHVSTSSASPGEVAGTTQSPYPMHEKATGVAKMSELIMLGEKLKKLNSYSSFLNILTLVALTSHLVYLGQRLHVSC